MLITDLSLFMSCMYNRSVNLRGDLGGYKGHYDYGGILLSSQTNVSGKSCLVKSTFPQNDWAFYVS